VKKVPSSSPQISIIYVTKNGGDLFRQSLAAVYSQETDYSYDVIVIDSGSTDGTVEWLQNEPVRLQQIPPEEFCHSRTRNLGASLARAEKYLVFMNQDAVPVGRNWLAGLVRSIEFAPGIMAAAAMELGSREGFFNVSGVAAYVFRNSAAQGVYVIEPHLLQKAAGLPAFRRRELFPFTTVCAIFDKEHFSRNPFDESVSWGEDLHWAVRNSNHGFKAACSSLAQVYHCHDYSDAERQQIGAHTARLYQELFGIEADADRGIPEAHGICPACDDKMTVIREIRASLSWRLTAPLRRLGSFFRRQ